MMELWTSPTPNGWKVSIMLEELIEAGVDIGDVQVRMINLLKGDQFKDDFVERNLNSKIPTLRDDGRDIIESCAILEYLGEKFRPHCCHWIHANGTYYLGSIGRPPMSVRSLATS
ncbi:MAG: hypothetical protein CM15mP120_14010 [Pseudomonadota bacterium]|nr:MAG: hypothetical protein CM15mP120_14010 [Pseudomonadota bacterium]